MNLCAIILNWCNASATITCAKSLIASGFLVNDIIIVDNFSPDNSVELLKNSLPNFNIIKNKLNSGYTGGNNFGMEVAFSMGYKAVLILNNDLEVVLNNVFFSEIASYLESKRDVLLGLPVIDFKTGKQTYPARKSRVLKNIINNIPQVDSKSSFDVICGCALIINREMYDRVGGLNVSYFMYCEELEYYIKS